jgi:acetyl-CoA carboxylase carboxyl transferase subunit alpha
MSGFMCGQSLESGRNPFPAGHFVLKPPAMRHFLDFEKPVAELEGKIEELRRMSEPDGINIAEEVSRLTEKADRQLRATYAKLTPWQKTQVARHPDRPQALAYINRLITDYTSLAGDRAFADDAAVVGGLGRFHGHSVVVLGTEKGSDTESRVAHNFGMARPEGYRKARRLIELAVRFGLPLLTFVDTSGAFPGVDAEARGQAEAIARSIGPVWMRPCRSSQR